MRQAYADFDLTLLNQFIKIPGAKIIGGKTLGDTTLRLYLVLDEPSLPFDKGWKVLDLPITKT